MGMKARHPSPPASNIHDLRSILDPGSWSFDPRPNPQDQGSPSVVAVYHSASPEQTRTLGEAVGRLADAGDVIALMGELGTGKTLFVGGLARGLGVDPATYVSSPTFSIMHRYDGRLPLYHIDLYRIETQEAFVNLGLDEYLEGEGVAAIEWAEHGWGCLPKEMLTFRLRHTGSDTRVIEIVPAGDRYVRLVQALMRNPPNPPLQKGGTGGFEE